MSYRTLKKLLGEANFEVKCLALFGLGLTVLAAATVALYWWRTSELIDSQNRTMARLMVSPIILEKHWTWSESESEFIDIIRRLPNELQPEDLRNYKWELFKADPTAADSEHRPTDQIGYEALQAIRQGASEVVKKVPEQNEYRYYGAVYATRVCIECHYHSTRVTEDGKTVPVKEGELIGVAKITLPLEVTEQTLHSTNAFVITAEFVKIVLSVVAIYLVIRYVVTKPVLHLKRVSDAIAHGNLDVRADIRTGDEFEELSHAFNRMLRHLLTVQEELRELNADLDAKVDELAQVNLKLYQTNKLKDEFLATMSHELRTPLNSILGFSEVLAAADNLTDRQKRYVANIATAGRNLLALINDVLDLAKIESGKMELHVIEFSLADLVERQVGGMMPMAQKKNIQLTWSVDPDIPPLKQDAGKLQQILSNLMSNAIKFTPEGGRVDVRAKMFDRERVDLIVEDTGIGIPLEDQEVIFEKFRQGRLETDRQDALTREHEGTGLGLSIVKELTRLLGGEVFLESEFGKGSTFTVRIPVRHQRPEGAEEDELHPSLAGVERLRAGMESRPGRTLAPSAAEPDRSGSEDAATDGPSASAQETDVTKPTDSQASDDARVDASQPI